MSAYFDKRWNDTMFDILSCESKNIKVITIYIFFSDDVFVIIILNVANFIENI